MVTKGPVRRMALQNSDRNRLVTLAGEGAGVRSHLPGKEHEQEPAAWHSKDENGLLSVRIANETKGNASED